MDLSLGDSGADLTFTSLQHHLSFSFVSLIKLHRATGSSDATGSTSPFLNVVKVQVNTHQSNQNQGPTSSTSTTLSERLCEATSCSNLVFLLGEKKKEHMSLKSYLLVKWLKTGLRLGVYHLIDVSQFVLHLLLSRCSWSATIFSERKTCKALCDVSVIRQDHTQRSQRQWMQLVV